MSKESRYGWTHGIVPRMSDVVEVTNGGGLTARKRTERVSFTFRKLRKPATPCCCQFPTLCDSQKDNVAPQQPTEIGAMAAKLEQENVHKVYNAIGSHFSETRHSPWPRVQEFIESLPNGAILLDVGCGNGKYLNINENVTKIGCDRSEKLLSVCNERGYSTFQCDCLTVPLRDQTVDACISIAVIHHLSTRERRLRALSEMGRILTTGGRALIYVWAKNQEADRKKSSYLRQNKLNNRPPDENVKHTTQDVQIECLKNVGDVALPIHTNRTQFQHQDMLVPWKLKTSESTFLRFYHVFEEHELEKLCNDVSNIKVVQSYYDQGNWCVIFQKQ
jgi:alkylated DNA repair protein alkB homolog 8